MVQIVNAFISSDLLQALYELELWYWPCGVFSQYVDELIYIT